MRQLCAAAVITMLLATVLAVPGSASEDDAPDHIVHAGAVPDHPAKPYVYEDYFPRDLKVHRGDSVRWEFPWGHIDVADLAFHTVTFAPDPADVPFVRKDEVPGTFAFEERSFFTSGCGRSGQPVCRLSDPDEFVSSGTYLQHFSEEGIEPFDAVIDLPPGTYSYFCTIHHPVMEGSIEVVDDDVELDNPAPEELAGLIAELTAEADALVAELSTPTPVDQAGQRTWTVHAGARTRDRGAVAVLGFLPASLSVRAGDAVRWVTGDEMHGVMFPDTGKDVPLYFAFGCDLDQPDSGAPGVPLIGTVGFFGLPWCPAETTLELALTPPGVTPHRSPGNAVVSPATYHSSGMMVPAGAPDRLRGKPPGSGEHFLSEFDATFPVPGSEPFTYRCQIHVPMMGGSISVEAG